MTRAQRETIILGLIAFIGIGIYPPWSIVYRPLGDWHDQWSYTAATSLSWTNSLPTELLTWSESSAGTVSREAKIDVVRLVIEWVVISVATGVIYLILRVRA